MQFAGLRGCSEREQSPGCGMEEYFGMKRDDQQRWPPGACEGPADNGRMNRGEMCCEIKSPVADASR